MPTGDRVSAIEALLSRLGYQTETHAERCLLAAVATGVTTRCSRSNVVVAKPPADWDREATIRAAVLEAVLLDRDIARLVTPRGVAISHAAVIGYLNLDESQGDVPVELSDCSLERLTLHNARIGTLLLSGSQLHRPVDGVALSADFATIRGAVFLDEGFRSTGEVSFCSAQISGGLDCSGGIFENPEGNALSTDGAVIGGGVFLRHGFRALGQVSLIDTEISEAAEFRGSFNNPGGDAIYADGIRVEGDLMFADGFTADGEVRLLDAAINGRISCSNGALFSNPTGDAFNADGARIRNGVFFRDGVKAQGTVSLRGADIGGGLDCSGGRFETPDGIALSAPDARIHGGVRLSEDLEGSKKPFCALGAVELSSSEVFGGFSCGSGIFNNAGGNALRLRRAAIHGSLTLDGSFTGRIVMSEARIDGTLEIDCPQATPGKVRPPILLVDAAVGTFSIPSDDAAGIALEGLTYAQIAPLPSTRQELSRPLAMIRAGLGVVAEGRLERRFHPQPYRQLERVLTAFGHDDLAVVVAITREKDHLSRGRLSFRARSAGWMSRMLLGFGYRPFRSVWLLLAILLCSVIAASNVAGFERKASGTTEVAGTNPHAARVSYALSFGDAVGYALDGLPGIDLGVRKAWETDPHHSWLRGLLWFETLAAWVLVPLFAASVTGLIRRP